MEQDLWFARQLQEQYDREMAVEERSAGSAQPPLSSSSAVLSVVDPVWELLDPNPDMRALFAQFFVFFGGGGGMKVKWSFRMTLGRTEERRDAACHRGRPGWQGQREERPVCRRRRDRRKERRCVPQREPRPAGPKRRETCVPPPAGPKKGETLHTVGGGWENLHATGGTALDKGPLLDIFQPTPATLMRLQRKCRKNLIVLSLCLVRKGPF
ncbi:uncharacterized protein LOC115087287 isoform X2 [Rhinatrema bivittatum]|uniref:uncharacterized protein LOC115087287 isoform X2 n=1 Tax=Rhinatrema bivittatum TaxID=194408 RepID=UPI00112BF6C0|nr:uncharacterized protein LOC115087287 isoform X2 [Rhinatrema bivittatum]